MKNLILISQDRLDISSQMRHEIVRKILDSNEFKIVLMVVNPSINKEEFLSYDGVEEVITNLEIEYDDSMAGLSYDDIIYYKDRQVDIENGAYRLYGDYQMGKYYYYSAIAFWNRFFKKKHVDVVFFTKAYHGFSYDCCELVARKYGVNAYHMIQAGYNNTYSIHKGYSLVPVCKKSPIDINYILQSTYDKTSLPPTAEKKTFIRKMLYLLGGNLLEDFTIRLVKWDWSPKSIIMKRAKITWWDKFYGYIKLQSIKRYMNSLSIQPNYNDKYIVYFLHVEPEASTQVCTVLESQLTIIKMLSETVPKGWYVYVKEHPVQFYVNNDRGYYHMFDAPLFKTKKFYKKINSMSNVRLVDIKTRSEELVKHSKAVASIVGTVFYESILIKKPILVFSDLNSTAYMKDSFSIHSYDDLIKSIGEIAAGFTPVYDDADDVIKEYIFKGESMPENILDVIRRG